ncbi:MAG: hypothetical protein BGP05_09155 [Rhizobiales bacterium 62-47]|nr:MAG: hypothetical protein BGP05_09155 [Rhizobiales bacterium 62-47]
MDHIDRTGQTSIGLLASAAPYEDRRTVEPALTDHDRTDQTSIGLFAFAAFARFAERLNQL